MPTEHHFQGDLQYTGHADASIPGGFTRQFRLSFEGKPQLDVSSPSTFSGDDSLHNPETLLVSSLMLCHALTYFAVCAKAGIVLTGYEDHGVGTLGIKDGKMRFTSVVLAPRMTLADPSQAQRAIELHDKAHANCFVGLSVNFPVTFDAQVV